MVGTKRMLAICNGDLQESEPDNKKSLKQIEEDINFTENSD